MEDTSLQAHTAGQTDLLFYTIAHLAIPHAMFTRQGGVSQSPFSGLNLSLGVGDEPTAVQVNREKVKKELNIQLLASAVQVHGDQIVLVEDLSSDHEYQGADALISAQAGVGLMIQQADCQAVLLHDPQRKAIAAIHNGWRGSVANIIAKTVQAMEEHFGTSPQDLQAVISPSLGPCCAEFIQYRQELPETFQQWQEPETYFDFWEISRWQLREAGLDNEQIKAAELCTMCNKDFFSYRRASKKLRQNGVTGRNGSVIVLPAE
ncbi:MAG: peptidoglycan editing factor PgeF [Candidatus Electrothrix aestuarii]|uniref:Purine nucleoside phosphorylase n=1 Tax=Candidatus Electrothrix aestuarii TaxID=3062594 RepID=A0AAU8LU89_9BACT|nr:peptidoglycan editing factor PgeF [Candidatus Electrothrix aestuarii]